MALLWKDLIRYSSGRGKKWDPANKHVEKGILDVSSTRFLLLQVQGDASNSSVGYCGRKN